MTEYRYLGCGLEGDTPVIRIQAGKAPLAKPIVLTRGDAYELAKVLLMYLAREPKPS